MGKAFSTVVAVIVGDQVAEVLEGDVIGEDNLAVERIRDTLLEEFDRVGAFRVRRRLANRAADDNVLDVPVVGALFSAVRVAVGALEGAAGVLLPPHRSASLVAVG